MRARTTPRLRVLISLEALRDPSARPGTDVPWKARLLDDALDVAFARRLARLDALVEHFEHAARLLARLARALDDDLVAVGVGDDAEPALDAGDVLVVMAEHHRGEAIVVEREGDLGRRRSRRFSSRLGATAAMRVSVWSAAFKSGSSARSRADSHASAMTGATTRPTQRIGLDADDFDLRHLADQRSPRLGVHRLHIGRAADDLAGMSAGFVEHHRRSVRPTVAAIERLPLALDQLPAGRRAARSWPPRRSVRRASAAGVPGRDEYLKA